MSLWSLGLSLANRRGVGRQALAHGKIDNGLGIFGECLRLVVKQARRFEKVIDGQWTKESRG